jgi:hypothetical protein
VGKSCYVKKRLLSLFQRLYLIKPFPRPSHRFSAICKFTSVKTLFDWPQDVDADHALKYPKLFTPGLQSSLFNKLEFTKSALQGIASSFVLFFIAYGKFRLSSVSHANQHHIKLQADHFMCQKLEPKFRLADTKNN